MTISRSDTAPMAPTQFLTSLGMSLQQAEGTRLSSLAAGLNSATASAGIGQHTTLALVVSKLTESIASPESGFFYGCSSRFEKAARVVHFACKIEVKADPTLGECIADLGKAVVDLGREVTDVVGDFVKEHPIATTTVLAAASGGLAYIYAAPIASAIGSTGVLGSASTGAKISSLSGAALKSASLAKLGGGALSLGGFGMSGGTIVVTATGAAGGTTAAAAGLSKDDAAPTRRH